MGTAHRSHSHASQVVLLPLLLVIGQSHCKVARRRRQLEQMRVGRRAMRKWAMTLPRSSRRNGIPLPYLFPPSVSRAPTWHRASAEAKSSPWSTLSKLVLAKSSRATALVQGKCRGLESLLRSPSP